MGHKVTLKKDAMNSCDCSKNCRLVTPVKFNKIKDSTCCTRMIGKKTYIRQPFFTCKTCSTDSSEGICFFCSQVCHLGHNVVFLPTYETSFCDCQDLTSKCCVLNRNPAQIDKQSNERLDTLAIDLSNILNNEKFSDICLQTKEGKKIFASKAIVCARSDFLKGSFNGNWNHKIEDDKTVVEVQANFDVFIKCIEYMYTNSTSFYSSEDKEEVDFDILLDVMTLSNEYIIHGLFNFCVEMVLDNEWITEDTAIELLKIAVTFKHDILQKETVSFIKKNKSLLEIKMKDLPQNFFFALF